MSRWYPCKEGYEARKPEWKTYYVPTPVLLLREDFVPREHLTMLGDNFLVVTLGGGVPGSERDGSNNFSSLPGYTLENLKKKLHWGIIYNTMKITTCKYTVGQVLVNGSSCETTTILIIWKPPIILESSLVPFCSNSTPPPPVSGNHWAALKSYKFSFLRCFVWNSPKMWISGEIHTT